MIVLIACGPTHKTGRSVQDGLPSTSTGTRGSEDDMPRNDSNSLLNESEPGKNIWKMHPPSSNDILAQDSQPMNYSLTIPALFMTLYRLNLEVLDDRDSRSHNICVSSDKLGFRLGKLHIIWRKIVAYLSVILSLGKKKHLVCQHNDYNHDFCSQTSS